MIRRNPENSESPRHHDDLDDAAMVDVLERFGDEARRRRATEPSGPRVVRVRRVAIVVASAVVILAAIFGANSWLGSYGASDGVRFEARATSMYLSNTRDVLRSDASVSATTADPLFVHLTVERSASVAVAVLHSDGRMTLAEGVSTGAVVPGPGVIGPLVLPRERIEGLVVLLAAEERDGKWFERFVAEADAISPTSNETSGLSSVIARLREDPRVHAYGLPAPRSTKPAQ